MRERSQVVAAAVVGAVVGGLTGYILFTERGKRLHRRLTPALDDLTREFDGFMRRFGGAAGVAAEGWKILGDVLGEGRRSRS